MADEKLLRLIGSGQRLDAELSARCPSRAQAARLIRDGLVTVDGVPRDKPSFTVPVGAVIEARVPPPRETALVAQDIPITILYEDDWLAAIDKPAGLVVHPAAGNPDGTLVNALMYRLNGLSGIGGELRPGIVHRLDKDTSGLIIVAKDDETHLKLSALFATRQVEKHYRAIVQGRMPAETGEIEAPIGRSPKDRKKMAVVPGGRYALTRWTLLRQYTDKALLDVHILTGRTHQIRVHMAHVGHPVLGDPIYGHRHADRLMLHSYSIRFVHPITGEALYLTAPCPFE